MVKIEYYCNICGKKLIAKDSEWPTKRDNAVFGLMENKKIADLWIYYYSHHKFQFCKKHICITCFLKMANLFNKYKDKIKKVNNGAN